MHLESALSAFDKDLDKSPKKKKLLDKWCNKLNKNTSSVMDSGNTEDIIKVIWSLKNRVSLLKETNEKIKHQKEKIPGLLMNVFYFQWKMY